MTMNVRINTQSTKINTRLQKIDFSLVNLEQLNNVDENVNGLEDGYTLIYDAPQQRWITTAIKRIDNIDGGTY
jgi:hypothetical protein